MSKWIKTILMFGILLFFTTSCHVAEPQLGNHRGEAIINALNQDINANNKLKNKTTANNQIPDVVNKSLMPQINLNTLTNEPHQDQRFDISVNNVPVRDFYIGLVKGTDYNVSVSPQLSGMVSLELKNVSVPEVMDEMRNVYGYEYFVSNNTYEILPKELQTRIFHVNYLDIKRAGGSQTSFGAGEITNNSTTQFATASVTGSTTQQNTNQSGSVQTTVDTDFWKNLQKNLELLVGNLEDRKIVVNPESGSIIVRAYPEELRNIAKYLDSIQSSMERQVMLEAQVVEVQLSAQFETGINWNLFNFHEGAMNNTTTTTSITNIPSDFGNIFTFNPTDGGTFDAVIQLLNLQGRSNILSNPRITATNNQKAVIKVGQDKFFVTNVTSNTATGTATTQSQNVELTPFFSGIALDVTPQIDEDDNMTLHIHPIVSKVVTDEQKFTANSASFDLPLALSTIRESDSIVHAKDNQIIIIGGLMENRSEDDEASTPGTEHWSWFKNLFRSVNKTASKYELVILLKPTIIKNNYNWNKNIKEASGVFKDMKRDFTYDIAKGQD